MTAAVKTVGQSVLRDKYISFPINGNTELFNAVYQRLLKLGAKDFVQDIHRTDAKSGSILLLKDNGLSWTYINENTITDLGDFNKLFSTEEYRLPPKKVNVKLNDDYTAEITAEGVKVGCQQFSLVKLAELETFLKKG